MVTQDEKDKLLRDIDYVGRNVITKKSDPNSRYALNLFLGELINLGIITGIGDNQLPPNTATITDNTTNAIKKLQELLGFPPKDVDGVWGPKTYNATKEYLQKIGVTNSQLSAAIVAEATNDPSLNPEQRQIIDWFARYNNLLVDNAIKGLGLAVTAIPDKDKRVEFIEKFRELTKKYIDDCYEASKIQDLSERKERIDELSKQYEKNVDSLYREYISEPIDLRVYRSFTNTVLISATLGFLIILFGPLLIGAYAPLLAKTITGGGILKGAIEWLASRFGNKDEAKKAIDAQIDYICDQALNIATSQEQYKMLPTLGSVGTGYSIAEAALGEVGINDPNAIKIMGKGLYDLLIRCIEEYSSRIPPDKRPEFEAGLYALLRSHASIYAALMANPNDTKKIEELRAKEEEIRKYIKNYEKYVKDSFFNVFVETAAPILLIGGIGAIIAALPITIIPVAGLSGTTSAFIGMMAATALSGLAGTVRWMSNAAGFINRTLQAIGKIFDENAQRLQQEPIQQRQPA
ncbi:MAG: hypothetical protein QXL47_00710 [Candidatus Anstonellales archaeon]